MKLTAKLVAVFLLVIIAADILTAYLEIQNEVRAFGQQTVEEAEMVDEIVERLLLEASAQSGLRGVLEVVETVNRDQHELRIRWVYFDADDRDPYHPMLAVTQLQQINRVHQAFVETVDDNEDGYLESYWPVAIDSRPGGLEISRPTTLLRDAKWQIMARMAWKSAASVTIIGLAMVLLGMRVVGRPLDQLIAKTRRAAAGDLSEPIHLTSRDELAELAESLNDMCAKLADAQQRLHAETDARIKALTQLRHDDRLRTVGRLASGIAHELGTPLNVVLGRARLISSGKLSSTEIADSAAAVTTEAERMTALIRRLLSFARRDAPRRALVDLRPIVQQTLDVLSSLAKERQVTMSFVPADEPTVAHVDVSQMQQVLTNLVVNAIQAMPRGGTVAIELGSERIPASDGSPHAVGNYLRIDVRDEGKGIATEHLPHLFEPFFTTKETGEGTGLGLSIAVGIVQDHHGWIDVTSEPGQGSCFTVYLPRETRS